MGYNGKAVRRYAAIAQQVERILGKDEVASSNLASSSKETVNPTGFAVFLLSKPELATSSHARRADLIERS